MTNKQFLNFYSETAVELNKVRSLGQKIQDKENSPINTTISTTFFDE
jgi:hypothetical protein